jgi:tumor protein p53-inducible protein 3
MSSAPTIPTSMLAVFAEDGRCSLPRTVPVPTLGKTDVLVRVHATAANRADLLQAKGKYGPPPGASEALGLEIAGEVVALGADARRGWAVGDRVMGLVAGGGYAEYAAVDEGCLLPAPLHATFAEAAAVPEAWLTAFQILHLIGGVKRGDNVLVHAAGSGVGTAATQLAAAAGARVVATAGAAEKLERAKALGAAAAVNRRADGGRWMDAVLAALEGRGSGAVDLVLDCVGGSYADQNAAVLATDGRWVLYGFLGGATLPDAMTPPLLATLLRKRARIEGTTLRARPLAYKRELVARFAEVAMPLLRSQAARPVVHTVLTGGLADAREAHGIMERNENNGKIVLQIVAASG